MIFVTGSSSSTRPATSPTTRRDAAAGGDLELRLLRFAEQQHELQPESSVATVGRGGYGWTRHLSDTYYDARAIFDPYRNRYWIVALVLNRKADDGDDSQKFPVAAASSPSPSRRPRTDAAAGTLLDRRGGGDGEAPLCPDGSCPVITGADYPSIGISPKYVALPPTPARGRRRAGRLLDPRTRLRRAARSVPRLVVRRRAGEAQLSDFPNPDRRAQGLPHRAAVHHPRRRSAGS